MLRESIFLISLENPERAYGQVTDILYRWSKNRLLEYLPMPADARSVYRFAM